ncbi:LytR family transcriptional regulator [Allosaccharopolyspora coralli]|uniref:LytR family transcriptional regulator n=1 Tax=Allosaccharopolyspora coralli TaxID=2665642 RepID=A0A5Q3Q4V1_9PSEU|nr:LytR C-terminal domain-containing protein [Allosaccharopolyspora coralli]QGK68526.1 LytR family transcriptional regulator [Allosaccharopolyspora coralli]
MSTPGPSGRTVAGFALVGVGVLAAVVGFTTLGSGERDSVAQPPESSVVTPPPEETQTSELQLPGEEETAPPTQDSPPPRPPSPADPPPAEPPQPPRPPEQGGEQSAEGTVVRVYNNSTISGLAERAAADFRGVGSVVAETGNYAQGTIYTTTIYYRPGTPEEEQARFLAEQFDARAEPRFPGLAESSDGVIAIVTNDYQGPKDGK